MLSLQNAGLSELTLKENRVDSLVSSAANRSTERIMRIVNEDSIYNLVSNMSEYERRILRMLSSKPFDESVFRKYVPSNFGHKDTPAVLERMIRYGLIEANGDSYTVPETVRAALMLVGRQ